MTQGKRKTSKTEVLKKQDAAGFHENKRNPKKDILDLENTIQKDIKVDDLSLEQIVHQSVDSAVVDLLTAGEKSLTKKKAQKTEKLHKTEKIPHQSPSSKDGFVLTLSNHLKIAEKKIKELENDNERLCLDNEKLMVAGEALKEAVDKFSNENKTLKSSYREERLSWSDQKNDFENLAESQSTEIKSLKMKINALEKHLRCDIRKVRVREKELENRLELKQNEMESVIRDKDHTLLKFKQELDLLREKAENDRQHHQSWMEQRMKDKERIGRAVQALQVSLQLLDQSTQQQEDDEFVVEEKSSEISEFQEEASAALNQESAEEVPEGGSPDEPGDGEQEQENIEEEAG